MEMFPLILVPDKPPTLLDKHYLAKNEVGRRQHFGVFPHKI